MRRITVALVAVTFLLTGSASANYTIDPIWSETGTASLLGLGILGLCAIARRRR